MNDAGVLEVLLQNRTKNLTLPGGKPTGNFNYTNDEAVASLVNDQCNGGSYQINPSNIRITVTENSKKTVFYYAYFLSYNSGWNNWAPAPHTPISNLNNNHAYINNKQFQTISGYSWVPFLDLKEECITQAPTANIICKFGNNCKSLNNSSQHCDFLHIDMNSLNSMNRQKNGTVIHPGLMRWVLSDFEKFQILNLIQAKYTEQKRHEEDSFIRAFQNPSALYTDEIVACELNAEFSPDFKANFTFGFRSLVNGHSIVIQFNCETNPGVPVTTNMAQNSIIIQPLQVVTFSVNCSVAGPFSSKNAPHILFNITIPNATVGGPPMYWRLKRYQLPIHILKFHVYKAMSMDEFTAQWQQLSQVSQSQIYDMNSFGAKLNSLMQLLGLQMTKVPSSSNSYISASCISNVITNLFIIEIDNNNQMKFTVTSTSPEVTETMMDLTERLKLFVN